MECEPKRSWCPPAAKGVVLLFIRRLTNTLLLIPQCGVWFRRILGTIDQLICLLTCDGGIIGSTVTVTDSLTVVRVYKKLAKHTIVRNHGPGKITLFELSHIVAILWPEQEWNSPMSGKMQLNSICDPGEQASVSVTTYLRCDCGVVIDYPHPNAQGQWNEEGGYYDEDLEPIGGLLI